MECLLACLLARADNEAGMPDVPRYQWFPPNLFCECAMNASAQKLRN